MIKKKRETLDIYYEVLELLSHSPARLTLIMRKCNLDTRMTNNVISTLIKGGLIRVETHGNYKTYHITEKGVKYMRTYESLMELLKK